LTVFLITEKLRLAFRGVEKSLWVISPILEEDQHFLFFGVVVVSSSEISSLFIKKISQQLNFNNVSERSLSINDNI